MLHLRKMVPMASLEQSNIEYKTLGVTSSEAKIEGSSFQEENLFLRETNRHLENKIARLYEMLTDKESDLTLREQACQKNAGLIHTSIAKLHADQKEMAQILQQNINDLVEAQHKIQRLVEMLEETQAAKQSVQEELLDYKQERSTLIKQIQDLERFIENQEQSRDVNKMISQPSPSWKNTASNFTAYRVQEENTVSSISPQINHVSSPKSRPISLPFGYSSQTNQALYMRGMQSRNMESEAEESRLDKLEAKVENLASDISEIKKYLQEIAKKMADGASVTSANKQEKVYPALQNYVNVG